MTDRTLTALAEPWRKFPQTVMFYATMWVVGAVVLTFLHVWFPPEKVVAPSTPPIEAPTGINPKAIITEPSPEIVSKARNAATQEEMQLADADSSVQIVAQLLENKDNNPAALEDFVAEKGFKDKYPLGFALYYSDGKQLLSYGISTESAIRFDSSEIKVTFEKAPDGNGVVVCLNLLPVRINGKMLTNFRDNCFGGFNPILHAVRLGNVSIDIEYLASSPRGAAWIIGMTP